MNLETASCRAGAPRVLKLPPRAMAPRAMSPRLPSARGPHSGACPCPLLPTAPPAYILQRRLAPTTARNSHGEAGYGDHVNADVHLSTSRRRGASSTATTWRRLRSGRAAAPAQARQTQAVQRARSALPAGVWGRGACVQGAGVCLRGHEAGVDSTAVCLCLILNGDGRNQCTVCFAKSCC